MSFSLNIFTPLSSVPITDFEQGNVYRISNRTLCENTEQENLNTDFTLNSWLLD